MNRVFVRTMAQLMLSKSKQHLRLALPAQLILPVLVLALVLGSAVWLVLAHQQTAAQAHHAHETLRQSMNIARAMLSQADGSSSVGQKASLQRVLGAMPTVKAAILTQDRANGTWQADRTDAQVWDSVYATLELNQRQALAQPQTQNQVTEFEANGQLHATLPLAAAEFPGGQALLWVRTDVRPLMPSWNVATWQLLGAALGACLLAGSLLWTQGRRLSQGLGKLSGWTQRATQEEWPEPPVPGGPTELQYLALMLRKFAKHLQDREHDIRKTAFRDTLTHLPNRVYFQMLLGKQISRAQHHAQSGALVTLDIQHFKQVNAMLGQTSGDTLLRMVAKRLSSLMPDDRHVLGRIGGNQFACLIPEADKQSALQMAMRLQQCLETTFELDGQAVDLMAQAGVTLFPHDGKSADALLSHSEMAMHVARKKMVSVMAYSPDMDPDKAASLSLLSELKQAVNQQELRLFLQPKICLQTNAVLGAEALMRWRHPSKGWLTPDRFIPFAEQTGFIRVLTLWAVNQAAGIWRSWQDAGLNLKIAVNLSTRDLMDRELPQHLHAILSRHQVPPGSLVLEINESAMMDDPQHAEQILNRLSELGFLLSIDDFGTGYSSLAYLKALPVRELKIDKSFVLNMQNDLNDAKIVRSVIDLAHNLGMSVVAEGLESAKSWKLLEGLHCDEAQGFFIHRPMPAEEFIDWVYAWEAPNVENEYLNTDFKNIL